MTKITKGCYVKTSEIKDTEEWKKVIDAFEEGGHALWENRKEMEDYWEDWNYLGVDLDGDLIHYHDLESFGMDGTLRYIGVQDLLGTAQPSPIEYKFVNDLSINMNQTKEERVSELGEEGWILGGIEPTGTYVFYREKS